MAEYVSNKEFYALLVDYIEKCKKAEEAEKPQPMIPNNIASCFIMIANRLATKSNFSGYTYKDDMIGDGIENCIRAVTKFNYIDYDNPFAYFTQIIWWAFLRRIEAEKKQTYVKYKALEHMHLEDTLSCNNEIGAYTNYDLENEKMKPIIEKFEKKQTKKKKKKIGVEKFIDKDK